MPFSPALILALGEGIERGFAELHWCGYSYPWLSFIRE